MIPGMNPGIGSMTRGVLTYVIPPRSFATVAFELNDHRPTSATNGPRQQLSIEARRDRALLRLSNTLHLGD